MKDTAINSAKCSMTPRVMPASKEIKSALPSLATHQMDRARRAVKAGFLSKGRGVSRSW